jgi:hypothetical protein
MYFLLKRFQNYFELDRRSAKHFLFMNVLSIIFIIGSVYAESISAWLFQDAIQDSEIVFLAQQYFPEKEADFKTRAVPSSINQWSLDDWKSMGLPAYLYERIQKFKRKGGRLNNLSDYQKIYGMKSEYLKIIALYVPSASDPSHSTSSMMSKKKKEAHGIPQKTSPMNINDMDTLQLKALPYIGSYSAQRIVKYRTMLGGFVDEAQYAEVYGLRPEALESLKQATFIAYQSTTTFGLADFKTLNQHLYLSYEDAQWICNAKKKNAAVCWSDVREGLSLKAQEKMKFLEKYFPCQQ